MSKRGYTRSKKPCEERYGKTFGKIDLIKAVADILDIRFAGYRGEPLRIVRAVLAAIELGLRRDGKVEIFGLGVFTVKHPKPRKVVARYFFTNTRIEIHPHAIPKPFVHFRAATDIRKVPDESQPSLFM